MVTRRRLLIAGAIAALALTATLLLTLLTGPKRQAVPAEAVEGGTQLSRSGVLFGDRVRASVQVIVDRRRVDPARVGFTGHFEPFVRLGTPQVARKDTGRLTRLVYSAELICLTNVCLSKDEPEPIHVQFPPVRVFYTAKSGGRHTLSLPWQGTTIGPRTTAQDLNGADPFEQPSWRATTDPLPVSYGTSPHTLRIVLFVAAGLLFALGLFALVRFAFTGRLRLRVLSPLERAVVLVERAPAESPEKRKALELLSHELSRSGEPELAVAAKQLAWAEPTPLLTLTQPLTLDVRRVITRRTNGHAA
ncbi:MAG: hypothetical protein AUG91_01290 [Actinobacteria bacterium 13_1_20CM_4_69_9]|nr:MAG: hypothetical protein AUG91_01290 [Actinobacteria bacterium 13_1_20CM_4_69_9]